MLFVLLTSNPDTYIATMNCLLKQHTKKTATLSKQNLDKCTYKKFRRLFIEITVQSKFDNPSTVTKIISRFLIVPGTRVVK